MDLAVSPTKFASCVDGTWPRHYRDQNCNLQYLITTVVEIEQLGLEQLIIVRYNNKKNYMTAFTSNRRELL